MKSKIKNLSKSLKKSLKTTKGRLVFASSIIALFIAINLVTLATTKTSLITLIANNLMESNTKYDKEIKSVVIESENYGEPGSWHIDKSAEWTGLGKAKVTFNVDTKMKTLDRNKDVILVIDISGSMIGDKLGKAKSDAIDLVDTLLDDPKNQVALITFDDTSTVVSGFTNNKQNMITAIDSLAAYGNTNYNQALKNVDKVMNNYIKEPNKGVVTLFLTDGYPNVETPNQIGTYKLLKDKYPYMTINGIQYEMGKDVIKQIKEISDNQWVADQSTLDNVLFEAAIQPFVYEKYEVVDYIDNDYFDVVSEDDITVSIGTVKLVNENGKQKVIWTIDSFMTGRTATMDINLVLKDKYKQIGGYYPTNEKEEITSRLPGEDTKKVPSNLTPVLKNQYEVIYDTNTPTGCTLTSIPNEPHSVYENVEIKHPELKCSGYILKGWKIIDEIQKVNDDVFIMPGYDVTIRALWSKSSIDKSMEGEVYNGPKLYDAVKEEAKKTGGQAQEYTEQVDDTFEKNADKDVYIYTGTTNNNVIFAEKCWKIVRTTTTGGVKILYNGEPTSNGACTATGSNATIGDSALNPNEISPAYVGYMYNKVYTYNSTSSPKGPYGADVEYKNGEYTLKETSETLDENHHYSCEDETDKCTTVRYYYYKSSRYSYYIELNGAENIEEALDQMLAQNVEDSTIKEKIDKWYKDNILNTRYKDQLEDTIFCNDRSMENEKENGWNPKGGSLSTSMYFKEDSSTTDLTCANDTDKFSKSNPVAYLKYPIGLLSSPEANLMGTSARNIRYNYWLGSPDLFINSYAGGRYVTSGGNLSLSSVSNSIGVRPAVSLKPGTVYKSGDGTTNSPFVID